MDADVGQNGIVDYFINETASGAGSDLFRLDRTSGTLRVNAPLDRETTPVYAFSMNNLFLSIIQIIVILMFYFKKQTNQIAFMFNRQIIPFWQICNLLPSSKNVLPARLL